MKRALALAAALLASSAAAALAADDPAIGATSFYDVYLAQHGVGGVPDATGRLRYAAVLSPGLNALLGQAAVAQARTAARIKASGPKAAVMPMLQGDIFTALFDGATDYQVGGCRPVAAAARCTITLTHTEPRAKSGTKSGTKPVLWHDTLVMAHTSAGWKMDDVIYDAAIAGGNTGTLSEMLRMVIASNP